MLAQLEDSLGVVCGYLSGEFCLTVPFGEKRVSYSPKSFTRDVHLLQVRAVEGKEVSAYRNLAYNPLDSHDNGGLFPHASANVETRGESVFALMVAMPTTATDSGLIRAGALTATRMPSFCWNLAGKWTLTVWYLRSGRISRTTTGGNVVKFGSRTGRKWI